MPFYEIRYKRKTLSIHKAITHPRFDEKTVLVTDTWDYVDLWLKRSKKREARFYWQQAKSFFDATKRLPKTSSPLTAYYCFLNAAKALLIAKGVSFKEKHGVSGFSTAARTSLTSEKVKIQTGGILAALCGHLGEPANGEIHSLSDILYNLPYVHRAYILTFKSAVELFIPVHDPRIVRSTSSHEAWFVSELTEKYASQATINKLPSGFEQESGGDVKKTLIRMRPRFDWRPGNKTASIGRYRTYHRRLRKHLTYIYGPQRLWYLKRGGAIPGLIPRSSITLTFAAMHRLSELSRYTPEKLARHFDCAHNWLLSEFIDIAPTQFIDEVSSEMTGMEFMIPGRVSNR